MINLYINISYISNNLNSLNTLPLLIEDILSNLNIIKNIKYIENEDLFNYISSNIDMFLSIMDSDTLYNLDFIIPKNKNELEKFLKDIDCYISEEEKNSNIKIGKNLLIIDLDKYYSTEEGDNINMIEVKELNNEEINETLLYNYIFIPDIVNPKIDFIKKIDNDKVIIYENSMYQIHDDKKELSSINFKEKILKEESFILYPENARLLGFVVSHYGVGVYSKIFSYNKKNMIKNNDDLNHILKEVINLI